MTASPVKTIPGITRGKIKKPANVLIYGVEGVGKSTFGAEAPSPIFLGAEEGSENLDVARFDPIKTFDELVRDIRRLITEDMGFETVVVDSLDWIEPMIWQKVIDLDPKKPSNIAEAAGGYNKGYIEALKYWKMLIDLLSELRAKRKMNIVSIAHSYVKAFNDPNELLPYDRYQMKLHDKAAALWRESVDAVLFANFQVAVHKANKNDKKGKGIGDDTRLIFTQRRPSYDAKNRYGLPPEIPMGWAHFKYYMDIGQPDSLPNILNELQLIEANLTEEQVARLRTAVTNANGNIEPLIKIRNYARILSAESGKE